MSGLTTRWKLPYPGLSDGPDGADVPYWMQALAVALDGVAMDDQGTLSARPVSTPASPGQKGRYYMQTDVSPHVLWRDYGTGWDTIGTVSAGSVGTSAIADGAVTTPKLADGAATTPKLADGAATLAKIAAGAVDGTRIADALKPSAGAAGATEALRALGTAAGTAAPGVHGSQHGSAGADPLPAGGVSLAQLAAKLLEPIDQTHQYRIQWAQNLAFTHVSGGSDRINYATAFATATVAVVAIPYTGTWYAIITGQDNAGFSVQPTVYNGSPAGGTYFLNYIAIGY